jgi:hypothetical protein
MWFDTPPLTEADHDLLHNAAFSHSDAYTPLPEAMPDFLDSTASRRADVADTTTSARSSVRLFGQHSTAYRHTDVV